VTVKGILVFWKAALFAGCRRNEGLGRSATLQRVSPRGRGRADDSGCPPVAEEGNVVSIRHKAYARGTAQSLRVVRGRVLRSVRRPVHVNPHYASRRKPRWWGDGPASRLGKPMQVGETFTGVGTADVARLAARHRSSQEERRVESKKRKEIEVSVPARIKSSRFGCSHVVVVAEVGRRRLASNKLGKRAPKRAVRVE